MRLRAGTLVLLAVVTILLVSVVGTGVATGAAPPVPPITVTAAFPPGGHQLPELTSTAALVINADSGQVLFSKNPDMRLPMASTTKIMTAILALDSLDLDTTVVVSRNAHFQNGSVIGLQWQETVTVEQLLYGLLVFSGNDCAVALAEKTAGSVARFVAKMNAKAVAMGLTNTHFENPDGLSQTGHYSSCADLAAMALYAMKNATFRKIVKTPLYIMPNPARPNSPRELKTSNLLLTKYDWVTGVKTGSTPAAGYCMVASGTQDGISLIVVQMGAKDDATRWSEVEALFQYGFDSYPTTALAQPGQVLTRVSVGDPLGQVVGLVPKKQLVTRLSKEEQAMGIVTLSHALTLPIRAGDVLGSVEFSLNGKSLGRVALVAQQAVGIPTFKKILVYARNWYLPEFVASDGGG